MSRNQIINKNSSKPVTRDRSLTCVPTSTFAVATTTTMLVACSGKVRNLIYYPYILSSQHICEGTVMLECTVAASVIPPPLPYPPPPPPPCLMPVQGRGQPGWDLHTISVTWDWDLDLSSGFFLPYLLRVRTRRPFSPTPCRGTWCCCIPGWRIVRKVIVPTVHMISNWFQIGWFTKYFENSHQRNQLMVWTPILT